MKIHNLGSVFFGLAFAETEEGTQEGNMYLDPWCSGLVAVRSYLKRTDFLTFEMIYVFGMEGRGTD